MKDIPIDQLDTRGFFHYMHGPGDASDNASVSRLFEQLGVNEDMLALATRPPEVAAFIGERYQPKEVEIAYLKTLPSETMGRIYADFLEEHHFNPHFFHTFTGDSDMAYLINRLRSTHDIWHVILGFDASEAGESGMNAFTFAQAGSPTTCLLMAAKLVRSISGPEEERQRMMRCIIRGYSLGVSLPRFLAVKWEERWEDPLDQIRRDLHLDMESSWTLPI